MIVAMAIALQLSAADEAALRGPGNEFHFQMCTLLKTTEYVNRNEPAETVVSAAMGGCATEYGKVRSDLVIAHKYDFERVRLELDRVDQETKRMMLDHVFTLRKNAKN